LRRRDETPYPNKGPDDFIFPDLGTRKPIGGRASSIADQTSRSRDWARRDRLAHLLLQSPGMAQADERAIETQHDLMRHANAQTSRDI
jgi:hypothetical protein